MSSSTFISSCGVGAVPLRFRLRASLDLEALRSCVLWGTNLNHHIPQATMRLRLWLSWDAVAASSSGPVTLHYCNVIRISLHPRHEVQQVIYVNIPEQGVEAASLRNTCSERLYLESRPLTDIFRSSDVCPSGSR